MEVLFAILVIIMLITAGYAKVQQNATKTVGLISFNPEEE